MLSYDRQYNYIGQLLLQKSKVPNAPEVPQDDLVNWLFLKTGDHLYSFVYKILLPHEAIYGKSFNAQISFTMIDAVKDIISFNHKYPVLRGPETIGTLEIIGEL